MATLNLPDCPQVLVWRLVKARLKADTVLAGSGLQLIFFEGDATGRNEVTNISNYGTPVLRFLATLGRMERADERSYRGMLIVHCELFVEGLDDEDALNVQDAIEAALNPEDDFVFHQSLIGAGGGSSGAEVGEPEFPQPLSFGSHDVGRGGALVATGVFTIEVKRGFVP